MGIVKHNHSGQTVVFRRNHFNISLTILNYMFYNVFLLPLFVFEKLSRLIVVFKKIHRVTYIHFIFAIECC